MTQIQRRPLYPGLSQDAYRNLEQGASLKGLLRVFKGNRDLELLAVSAAKWERQLADLMQDLVAQANQPPLSLLDIRLVRQDTLAGSSFLRWRTRDYSQMGVAVWQRLMDNPALSPALREGLHRLECDRITLNMQMSVVHSLLRQSAECVNKFNSAEQALHRFIPSEVQP
ncbi:DUF3158 family protein [Pseudomonas sp. LRF_L74]|uniref:DUF3158 family protein n=1 Tax=Pseudomonas sp. LRF_L74 TaxID=3369422 RepID=UPI003F5D7B27